MQFPFSYILLIPIFFACKENNPQPEAKAATMDTPLEVWLTNEQVAHARLDTQKAQPAILQRSLRVHGIMEAPPEEKATVSAMYGGYIKQFTLVEGMKVSKGSVLALLENPAFLDMQQAYLEALAHLQLARQTFDRQSQLDDAQINAKKNLQEASANLALRSATCQGLEARLVQAGFDPKAIRANGPSAQVALKAPISGFVIKANVHQGMYLSPNDVLVEIVNNNHLHATLSVFEKDVKRVAIGQQVRIWTAADGAPAQAKVFLIGKSVAPDRSVMVHCHFDVDNAASIPGAYLTAEIAVEDHEAVTVPEQAVLVFMGKNYVVLPLPRQTEPANRLGFRLVEVATGTTYKGRTAISSGIPANTTVISQGAYTILSAIKNKPMED